MKEGYIKYKSNWQQKGITIPNSYFKEIEHWRNQLYDKGMIGLYNNGIGFGNISMRIENSNQFYITGSTTGKYSKLELCHLAKVEDYSLENNSIDCVGSVIASSESLSHAIIYETLAEINSIIHIHHFEVWKKSLNKFPTTNINAEYGTPEIANEIKSLLQDEEIAKQRIIIMGGHEEGIISFGKDMKEAMGALLGLIREL
ncbi:MAG: class II aldolase/adducin family protein [Saprospiraceae bacterium]|nr:class II aldolase/adducin family protein [Saprospiraceae bacterium]